MRDCYICHKAIKKNNCIVCSDYCWNAAKKGIIVMTHREKTDLLMTWFIVIPICILISITWYTMINPWGDL